MASQEVDFCIHCIIPSESYYLNFFGRSNRKMLYPFPNYFRSIVLSINVWLLDQVDQEAFFLQNEL
ncbi:hypothetical protein BpHYR1_040310 [Brachionus plicatilis]|uniref:Uncharacterized protein n=1 Tax=Brachionus plicatilis TaxID=10195 RepID=A0A3M7PJD4_BRAPC|nr:hypothetical protein BpHYR1_040310 [Brachionus plicatilis]